MSAVNNDLIARLAEPDRLHLLSCAQDVPLTLSQVLWQPGEPIAHVYFPTWGFVCLIATGLALTGPEVGMVGREGMLGVQAVLGSERTPSGAVVQGDGRAWRVATNVFPTALWSLSGHQAASG